MRKTNIPYDLTHQLEADFGSLAQVPEDNPILINIRKMLKFDRHCSSLKVSLREDIQNLLDEGYLVREVADMLTVSTNTVRESMRMFNMKTRPRFRYKVVKLNTGECIYGNVYQDFSRLINVNCPSFELAQSYLSLEGYKLIRCDSQVLWGELKKGQKYYQNGQLQVKK